MKVVWINITLTLFAILNNEKIRHTLNLRNSTVPFFQGYVLVNSFHDFHWQLCDEHNEIRFSRGVGTGSYPGFFTEGLFSLQQE
jgi:hypothetical protein